MPPATNLTSALSAFAPSPLNGSEDFYVPRGSRVDRLLGDLIADHSLTTKVLFVGQRGSGKSTELRRLARGLQDTHIVVSFDIDAVLDPADIDFRDVLVTLGLQLIVRARELGVPVEAQADDLLGWARTITLESTKEHGRSVEGEAGLGAWIAQLGIRMKQETQTRVSVRRQIESRLSELLAALNRVCAAISERDSRPIIVIIDGLDRVKQIDSAVNLFSVHGVLLTEPACKIVYTLPPAIYYSKDMGQVRTNFDEWVMLPNLKPLERSGSPCDADRAVLSEMVLRRISPALITPSALDRLVTLSGGLVRELMTLSRQSVSYARHARAECVDGVHIGQAAADLRSTYAGYLTRAHREELRRRHADKDKDGNALALEMLYSLALIEYPDHNGWYDAHPVLWSLIDS